MLSAPVGECGRIGYLQGELAYSPAPFYWAAFTFRHTFISLRRLKPSTIGNFVSKFFVKTGGTRMMYEWCRRRDSNPQFQRTADFKSAAYSVLPLRHISARLSEPSTQSFCIVYSLYHNHFVLSSVFCNRLQFVYIFIFFAFITLHRFIKTKLGANKTSHKHIS